MAGEHGHEQERLHQVRREQRHRPSRREEHADPGLEAEREHRVEKGEHALEPRAGRASGLECRRQGDELGRLDAERKQPRRVRRLVMFRDATAHWSPMVPENARRSADAREISSVSSIPGSTSSARQRRARRCDSLSMR